MESNKIKRYNFHIITCLIVILGSSLVVSAQSEKGGEPRIYQVEKALYKFQAGDTLEAIAKKFLGGEEFVDELIAYNKITDPSTVKEDFIIVLPGTERGGAVEKVRSAQETLGLAREAMAETYALAEYNLAKETIDGADQNRREGAYDKATAQGEVGKARAIQAKELADKRAVIDQPAKVTAAHGLVEVSADRGKTWSESSVGAVLPVGGAIRTSVGSRAELTLGDGSVVQVQESTEFKLNNFSVDRRNNKRNSQLQVSLGNILGKIQKQKNANSKFHVRSRSTILAVRGTNVRMGTDSGETTRVALLHGDVVVEAKEKQQPLTNNYGTFVKPNAVPSDAVELIQPPFSTFPSTDVYESSVQQIELKWQHRKLLTAILKPSKFTRPDENVASYHVEIATDDDFNYIEQNHLTTKNYLTTDVLAPGEYYWRISSIDEHGLEGAYSIPKKLRILRDQLLTIVSSIAPVVRDSRWIVGPAYVLNIQPSTADTSIVSYEFSLNDEKFQPTDGGINFRTEGAYIVKVRGVGADGYVGEPFVQEIELDKTPPTISSFVTPATEDPEIGQVVYVTFDVLDKTGVKSTLYRIDGGEYQPYDGPIKVSVDNPYVGVHMQATDIFGKDVMDKHFKRPLEIKVECYAIDKVGNSSKKSLDLSY